MNVESYAVTDKKIFITLKSKAISTELRWDPYRLSKANPQPLSFTKGGQQIARRRRKKTNCINQV